MIKSDVESSSWRTSCLKVIKDSTDVTQLDNETSAKKQSSSESSKDPQVELYLL